MEPEPAPKTPPPSPRDRTPRALRAVEQCQAAWSDAYRQATEKHLPQDQALRMAAVAYKLQIPKMTNLASIKNALACIAQGMALEVFQGNEGSQLLYAVQVAKSVHNAKGARK